MFRKILIADRGDNVRKADVAAKVHVGAADVTPQPNRVARAACSDRATEH